jgi:hypothetical protein
MNEGLAEIKNSVSSLLNWAVQSMGKDGVCYLLYHIRNDVYVPIQVSDHSILEAADYYLAFSRLQPTDFLENPTVVQLTCEIPTLLQRGRVESLFFKNSNYPTFWQELVPVSRDNRMVLVRSSFSKFAPIGKEARDFALHWSCYAHSQWEKAGNTFFTSFLTKAEMATCQEVVEHLAHHLADKDPFPPFYEVINFQLVAKAAHEPATPPVTRCNPLGFNTGIVLDFRPDKWPWIPAMPNSSSGGNHAFHEYIPDKYPDALPADVFYKSIVQQTEDLVVKVCECSYQKTTWQFFARHNRLKISPSTGSTSSHKVAAPLSTDNPLLAVATILSSKPIDHDHLVTLWAVNPSSSEKSLSVGSRVNPDKFPQLNLFEDDHENKVIASGSDPKGAESLVITFQPASGCSQASLKLLKENLQKAADSAFVKIRMLAPAERLKAIYRGIVGSNLNWKRHFTDKGGRKLHDVTDFKANATDAEWQDLGESVIAALKRLDGEVTLWPCLKAYDASSKLVYACIGKAFDQKAICPELATCFAGGAQTIFDAAGYWLVQDFDRSKTPEGAAEMAAGLILLGRSLRLSSAEYSPTLFPSVGATARIGTFKLGFEGNDGGRGDTTLLDRKPLEKIQEFARCCFNELPSDEAGKKHWVQTAVQLIRPFARILSGGFVQRDGKMAPAIYLELRLTEKP